MKKVIKLNENQLRNMCSKVIRRILNEENGNMSPEQFKTDLRDRFYKELKELFFEVVDNWGEDRDLCEDYVDEYAWEVSGSWAEKAIIILDKDNWNYPSNNLRTLDFVMNEHGIHNFQELLNSDDPVGIFTSWFWECFGTYAVKDHFGDYLSEMLGDEEENEDNLNESRKMKTLKKIVNRTVKKVLSEGSFDAQPDFCDIKGIKFIWHGEWSDPEVKYGNKYINYYDVEDYVINLMDEEGVSKDKPFDEYCRENAEVIKAFIDENGKEEEEEDFEY